MAMDYLGLLVCPNMPRAPTIGGSNLDGFCAKYSGRVRYGRDFGRTGRKTVLEFGREGSGLGWDRL
jgi:hypothetical protein